MIAYPNHGSTSSTIPTFWEETMHKFGVWSKNGNGSAIVPTRLKAGDMMILDESGHNVFLCRWTGSKSMPAPETIYWNGGFEGKPLRPNLLFKELPKGAHQIAIDLGEAFSLKPKKIEGTRELRVVKRRAHLLPGIVVGREPPRNFSDTFQGNYPWAELVLVGHAAQPGFAFVQAN